MLTQKKNGFGISAIFCCHPFTQAFSYYTTSVYTARFSRTASVQSRRSTANGLRVTLSRRLARPWSLPAGPISPPRSPLSGLKVTRNAREPPPLPGPDNNGVSTSPTPLAKTVISALSHSPLFPRFGLNTSPFRTCYQSLPQRSGNGSVLIVPRPWVTSALY